jgi:hypothetical protein
MSWLRVLGWTVPLMLLGTGCGASKPARIESAAPAKPDTEGMFRGLRDIALSFVPTEVAPGEVYGVVVDWGYAPGVIITTAALSDGTVSMYMSTGGGILGGGEHAPVRAAGATLIAEATRAADRAGDARTDLPKLGEVFIHLLSDRGVRTIVESWPPSVSPASDRARLLIAWQETISEVGKVSGS